jgi:1-acyl-sn-glycerol-3-phosphate acyltransferase
MTSHSTDRHFALPGRKVDVTSRRLWARAILHGTRLFGPSYRRLMRAAGSGDRSRLHAQERAWCAEAASAIDLTVDVSGLDRIDPTQRYIVAPLHEGFLDLVALQHLPLDMAYTATDELFSWQFLGPYLEASRQTSISPINGAAAYRSLLGASDEADAHDESLVVFPQGSVLGIEVAFHRGAFRLAERSGLPLLPVVLTGAATVWDYPFSTTLRFGGTIRLEVLPPMPSDEAVAAADTIEREMKERALLADPGPRRFDPARDGWWDGYRYEIDPSFPEVLEAVAQHRHRDVVPST